MCQTMKGSSPHMHSQNPGSCCTTGLAVAGEIRLPEEQKRDLAAIIARIDAKIECLRRERP
jgi:hypothetical protein